MIRFASTIPINCYDRSHRSFQESSSCALFNFRTEIPFALYEATDAYNVAEFPRVPTSSNEYEVGVSGASASEPRKHQKSIGSF